MSVRNLKILKGVIYAEVEVGGLDNGGWVTMNVKLAKGEDQAVTEALTQLNSAVEAVAAQHLAQVSDNRIIDERVNSRLTRERARHKEGLQIQRRTLVSKLRDRALRYSMGGIDQEIRKVLNQVADDVEREMSKKAS